jgi:hypothetical protein
MIESYNARVRIQKLVVANDIVNYNRKAVWPDLFTTLPNVFAGEIFANNY